MRQLFIFPTILIFCSLFIISCDNNSTTQFGILPNSTGGSDEILAVLDKDNSGLVAGVNNTLSAPYEVLPQPEPLFDTRMIDFENFDRIFKRFRTIVFFTDLKEQSTLAEFVREIIGEDNVDKALKNENFYYAVKRNVWAEPQLVFFVFAPNEGKLMDRTAKLGKIISLIQENELGKYKNRHELKGWNHTLTTNLKKEHGVILKIPEDFVLALEEDDFTWIRKILPEFNSNIMIDIKDMSSAKNIDPIKWRNALGKEFISTTIEGSYMVSDTILPFAKETRMLNGLEAEVTRGLWKMQGDFMGGPFLNYLIKDPINNRMILLDGFVYAPGEKKKPLIRNLEAIFSQFETVNKPTR